MPAYDDSAADKVPRSKRPLPLGEDCPYGGVRRSAAEILRGQRGKGARNPGGSSR